MSGGGQLRFVIIVFFVFGAMGLTQAGILHSLGRTPRIGPIVLSVVYIVAAWQLWRGSVVAQYLLTGLSVLGVCGAAVVALFVRGDDLVITAFALICGALALICAWLLLLSRPLKSELKARRILHLQAQRRAFEKAMSQE